MDQERQRKFDPHAVARMLIGPVARGFVLVHGATFASKNFALLWLNFSLESPKPVELPMISHWPWLPNRTRGAASTSSPGSSAGAPCFWASGCAGPCGSDPATICCQGSSQDGTPMGSRCAQAGDAASTGATAKIRMRLRPATVSFPRRRPEAPRISRESQGGLAVTRHVRFPPQPAVDSDRFCSLNREELTPQLRRRRGARSHGLARQRDDEVHESADLG
jgi:hypothetical protein